jgi:DNA-binding NarL/FixJ family response regulator
LPIRVLIADDSEVMRRAVFRLLASEQGIEVVGIATNVSEMIHLRKLHKPDIVIMDLRMAEQVPLEEPASQESCLLAMSASDAIENQARARDLGAAAFLDKMELFATLIPKIFELSEAKS